MGHRWRKSEKRKTSQGGKGLARQGNKRSQGGKGELEEGSSVTKKYLNLWKNLRWNFEGRSPCFFLLEKDKLFVGPESQQC